MTRSTEGCTYCGSDAHTTTACPMRGEHPLKGAAEFIEAFTDKAMTAHRNGEHRKFIGISTAGASPTDRDIIGEVIEEDKALETPSRIAPFSAEQSYAEARRTAEYWKAEHIAANAIIAQRDARIEEQTREIERGEQHRNDMADRITALRTELAALKAQPSGDYFGEFSKGDTDKVGDCDKFEAGIHHLTVDAGDMVFDGKIISTDSKPGTWFQRIVVYGSTAGQAEALRDFVLERIAQPSGVVQVIREYINNSDGDAIGRGAALDALESLNSSPVSAGDNRILPCPPTSEPIHAYCSASAATSTVSGNHVHDPQVSAGGVDERAALEAIDWLDDFVARCNGDDRGACESVNIIRAALNAGSAVPDGWVVVPLATALFNALEAYKQTRVNFHKLVDQRKHDEQCELIRQHASAMLAAAPTAKKEG